MLTLVTILIALDCILLIGVVLIQNPKGGGIDSTMGGASANQMFGAAKSADFVEKLTWYLAAILFVLCIAAAVMSTAGAGVPTGEPEPTEQPAGEAPAEPQ
jgi:preprotein translocase subunit SecG